MAMNAQNNNNNILNQTSLMNQTLQNNMTGLSFVGKSTLFSRVALSP